MEHLVYEPSASPAKRCLVALLLSVFVALMWVYPNWSFFAETTSINHMPEGPRTLCRHVFVYSVPWVILASLMLFLGNRFRIIKPPSFLGNLGKSLLYGSVAFLMVYACVKLVSLFVGPITGSMDAYGAMGNLASNLYEEVIWRALLFPACYYVFRNKPIAFAVPAVLFALTHSQYGVGGQVIVGFGALVMTFLYYRTGNLVSSWLYHWLSNVFIG